MLLKADFSELKPDEAPPDCELLRDSRASHPVTEAEHSHPPEEAPSTTRTCHLVLWVATQSWQPQVRVGAQIDR